MTQVCLVKKEVILCSKRIAFLDMGYHRSYPTKIQKNMFYQNFVYLHPRKNNNKDTTKKYTNNKNQFRKKIKSKNTHKCQNGKQHIITIKNKIL